MKLQDWWDCTDWDQMSRNRWTGESVLDWNVQTLYDWKYQSRQTWAGEELPTLQPLFPPVPLESLGFSQDEDFVYIPNEAINAPSWLNVDWLNMEDWNFTLSRDKWLSLLLLKLQSANLPAHKVTGVGVIAENQVFILESRAEVIQNA